MGTKNKNKISENLSIFVKNENYEKTDLIIEDKEEVKKYSIQEIKNKVIHGDAFNVLPKIEMRFLIWCLLTLHIFYNCQTKN
jgi:hypothetical protein